MMPVAVTGVSHGFGRGASRVDALSGVTLDIAAGEVVVLLGPSGCGKTTLLRMMAGLAVPDAGTITVGGAAPVAGRGSAMVFQSFRLLPWKTALQNVTFALHGRPDAEDRAARYLDLVGLARFARAYPAQLSGGMRQRLALARALAVEPGLLLMDEPFASLDAQVRELMQEELRRLIRARPATVVFVTHSVDEALLLADRIVLMSPRPGRIVEELRPETRDRDAPAFIAARRHLWERLREMVLGDPRSDFYGRGLPNPRDPC